MYSLRFWWIRWILESKESSSWLRAVTSSVFWSSCPLVAVLISLSSFFSYWNSTLAVYLSSDWYLNFRRSSCEAFSFCISSISASIALIARSLASWFWKSSSISPNRLLLSLSNRLIFYFKVFVYSSMCYTYCSSSENWDRNESTLLHCIAMWFTSRWLPVFHLMNVKKAWSRSACSWSWRSAEWIPVRHSRCLRSSVSMSEMAVCRTLNVAWSNVELYLVFISFKALLGLKP